MSKNKQIVAVVFVAIFLVAFFARIAAFSQPYHHDEYDFAMAADPSYGLEDFIPHPYLSPTTYRVVGSVVGYDHLRVVPIVLSLATLALLFYYVGRRWGLLAGVFASGVYAFSAYGLLGGVQIDIDGAFLPFFTILAFIAYERFLLAEQKRSQARALSLLAVVIFFGLSAKLSFILVPATFVLHYLFVHTKIARSVLRNRRVLIAGGVVALLALLAVSAGSEIGFLRYIDNFTSFAGRDYMQVAFQTVKAALYVSPIVLGLLLAVKHWGELKSWFMFLGINVLFYYVLFDFTHRTFDRYLLFAMLPMAVLVGVAFARSFAAYEKGMRTKLVLAGIGAAAIAAVVAETIASMPHRVIPLIPKSAFIESVLSLRLDFLLPMTGGSGPLGFYVPVDALMLLWGAALLALGAALFASNTIRAYALAAFIGICLSHTALVTTEYLWGMRYGSAPKVAVALLEDIQNRDTGPILTYNDIGAFDLMEMGKYAARFYPHAEFIPGNIEKLRAHEGLFLVVGLPRIAEDSIYGRFFASCEALSEVTDGLVQGQLLECSKAKGILAAP
jgi:hypothetical protein